MSFEEFEHQARLYVVGALEHEELGAFEDARRSFGAQAEACIIECRRLNEVFALTLRPQAPRQEAKDRLMSLIQKSLREKSRQV
jgi:hypothetical protein